MEREIDRDETGERRGGGRLVWGGSCGESRGRRLVESGGGRLVWGVGCCESNSGDDGLVEGGRFGGICKTYIFEAVISFFTICCRDIPPRLGKPLPFDADQIFLKY